MTIGSTPHRRAMLKFAQAAKVGVATSAAKTLLIRRLPLKIDGARQQATVLHLPAYPSTVTLRCLASKLLLTDVGNVYCL